MIGDAASAADSTAENAVFLADDAPSRILLAGTHRCGSTWVANVLRTSPGLRAVYEPDCHRTGVLGKMSNGRVGEYPAICPGDRSFWYSTVWDLAFKGGWPWNPPLGVRRLGRTAVSQLPKTARDYSVAALARGTALFRAEPKRLLVKSADCALSLEWIAERYRPRIVLQRRNPLNVISSWISLNIDADRTLSQRAEVQKQWLEPLGIPPLPSSSSAIAQVAWTVGVLMTGLRVTSERHRDWLVVSHDALCEDPRGGFQQLFRDLGLAWTEVTVEYLDAADEPGFVDRTRNPRSERGSDEFLSLRAAQATQYQRRLTAAQIAEVRAVLGDLPLGNWGPPAQ